MTPEQERLMQAFRAVLEQVGFDISAAKYDALKIAHKSSRQTLQRHMSMSWSELKAAAAGNDIEVNDTYQALMRQNKRLVDRLQKERDANQIIIDTCLAEMSKISFKPAPIPPRQVSSENLEFHLMRSDAQVGQYTDERWTQGIACYNAQIYKDRVQRLQDKVTLFREEDHLSHGLNKLVIYHLGDQVDGERIFRGQAFSIDLAGVDQLFFSVEVEAAFVLALASVFPEVEIFCVSGNHGRPGKKGEHNPRTNFDYIFYRVLQMALAPQENVTVHVAESPSMLIDVGNFRAVLNHGDIAKSWNGLPYYGLDRAARRVHDLYGMIIHYNFYGHHHTPCNLADNKIMNGCLPGGSDLSVNAMQVASLPSQKCFYFHPHYGINRESNLYLADPVKLEADEHGIYTSHITGVA